MIGISQSGASPDIAAVVAVGRRQGAPTIAITNDPRSPLAQGHLGQFPPEPIRYIGSLIVRNAIRRKERAEDLQREPWLIDKLLSKFANAAGKSDKAT